MLAKFDMKMSAKFDMNETQFLEKLKTLKKEDLSKIKGLGDVLINNLLEFFESERFEYLTKESVGLEILQSPKIVGKLSGNNICITGSFDISRDLIKEKLELLGAKIVGTVGKNTTLLLAGEDSGSKLAKAQSLKIPIVTNYQELL